jgi:acetolactate decarboxylase
MNSLAWLSIAAISFVSLGCSPAPTITPATGRTQAAQVTVDDALVQFSLLSALAADDYTEGAPLADVLASGDFGIGTFNRLDGEMIVLDGKIYQALANGAVRAADLAGTTPFAAVTFFAADGELDAVSAATLDDLDEQLDRKLPLRNSPYALRITGELTALTIRSVPVQSPPFRPLVQVVKDQVTWQHQHIRGTLVGFRCPGWMGTLNVAGYHWHFLSDDHTVGGHVLDCEFTGLPLEYDDCTSVVIHIPSGDEFQQFDEHDVSDADVDKIERQRAHP